MVRVSISIALGGILRRLDPLGQIYGSVTWVPYFQELYIEKNTEKLKPVRIVLKHLQMP